MDKAERGAALPLLCYALDDAILSQEAYEKAKDGKISEGMLGSPVMLPAILLLFIRNYYERSDGKDYWKSSKGLQEIKLKFLGLIQEDRFCRNWTGKENNSLFPAGTGIGDWLKSQCWILKAKEGGTSSQILKNNAAMWSQILDSCDYSLDRFDWQDLIQEDESLNEILKENDPGKAYFGGKAVPRYIKELCNRSRREYFYSLKAVVSSKLPEDMGEYRWLVPLCNIAPEVESVARDGERVSAAQRRICKPQWKLVCQFGSYALVLYGKTAATEVVVQQDGAELGRRWMIRTNSASRLIPCSVAKSIVSSLSAFALFAVRREKA